MDVQDSPPPPGPFAVEMRRHRIKAGSTVAVSAARARISQARWNQLEKGHYNGVPTLPMPETAAAIAYAIGWDPEAAFDAAGYAGAPIPEPKPLSLEEEFALLPAKHRQSVARIFELANKEAAA